MTCGASRCDPERARSGARGARPPTSLRLARRLRRLSPDLVHTNSLKAGVYGSIAARLAGVPVVWHVRDRVAEDYIPAAAVRLVRALVRRLADRRDRQLRRHARDARRPRPGGQLGDPGIGGAIAAGALTRRRTRRSGCWAGSLPGRARTCSCGRSPRPSRADDESAVLIGSPMFGEQDYERSLHELVGQPRPRRAGCASAASRRTCGPSWRSSTCSSTPRRSRSRSGPWCSRGWPPGWRSLAPDQGGPAAVIEDDRTGRLFRMGDQQRLAAAMRELGQDDPAPASVWRGPPGRRSPPTTRTSSPAAWKRSTSGSWRRRGASGPTAAAPVQGGGDRCRWAHVDTRPAGPAAAWHAHGSSGPPSRAPMPAPWPCSGSSWRWPSPAAPGLPTATERNPARQGSKRPKSKRRAGARSRSAPPRPRCAPVKPRR